MKAEDLKKFQDELEQNEPKFNGGECKVACNCIEIAEHKAGQQGVKSYPCLGGSKADILESFAVQKIGDGRIRFEGKLYKDESSRMVLNMKDFREWIEFKKGVESVSDEPTDKEVNDWYDINIGNDPDNPCSASSAIYKYRLWLRDRDKTQGEEEKKEEFKFTCSKCGAGFNPFNCRKADIALNAFNRSLMS